MDVLRPGEGPSFLAINRNYTPCPAFPGQVTRYHWGFDDPAHATGTEEEILAEFRRVRDEIRAVFGAYAAGLKVFASPRE
jgi:protein-tyrosine-phosphatase